MRTSLIRVRFKTLFSVSKLCLEKTHVQGAALASLVLLLVLEARCAHFFIAHFNNIVCCGVVHHCSHTSHIIHDDKLAHYKDVSGHYRDCNGNSSAHVQGKK